MKRKNAYRVLVLSFAAVLTAMALQSCSTSNYNIREANRDLKSIYDAYEELSH